MHILFLLKLSLGWPKQAKVNSNEASCFMLFSTKQRIIFKDKEFLVYLDNFSFGLSFKNNKTNQTEVWRIYAICRLDLPMYLRATKVSYVSGFLYKETKAVDDRRIMRIFVE